MTQQQASEPYLVQTPVPDGESGFDEPAAARWIRSGHTRHAARYLTVGALSFLLDLGVLTLTHSVFGTPLAAATVAGSATALVFNFALNRRAVFPGGNRPLRTQVVRFLLLVALNFASTALIVVGLASIGVPYPIGKVCAAALLVLLNYVAYRRWVF